MEQITWKKWLANFLLKIVQKLSQNPEFNKPKIRKESYLHKDIHIPILLIGIVEYLSLVLILIFSIGPTFHNLIVFPIFIAVIMFISIYFLKKFAPQILSCDDSLAFISFILIAYFFVIIFVHHHSAFHFLFTPLPSAAMIMNILLGPLVAFIVSFVLIFIMTLVYEFNFAVFITMFFMCIIAIIGTRNVLNRKDITKTGIYVGIFNFLTIFCLYLLYIFPATDLLNLFLWGLANGIISAIITIGVLPYFENVFSVISNIKLLEYSDFSQPLLKRMMIEIPGTYHHSLIVGNLAESAAREIGANPLLVRVGAYYHDIGKIEKAEYFVENKPRHMMNKHNELTPNLSSLIIIAHVKDGVNIARKHKFAKKIIDIIEQHHGDGLLYYFYHKAKQEYGDDVVESQYHYPGPKPHSKEAAIVMLADSVEAATHTEEDFSHSNLKSVVNKIISNKFVEGQLDEAQITLYDLNIIAKSFVKTLVGVYHDRIIYPEQENSKTK